MEQSTDNTLQNIFFVLLETENMKNLPAQTAGHTHYRQWMSVTAYKSNQVSDFIKFGFI
jgi:hypothetical protein